MPALFQSSIEDFLFQNETNLLGRLVHGYAADGFTSLLSDQTLTWDQDLKNFRSCFGELVKAKPQSAAWEVLLEFSIPRKEKRIDVVLLAGATVVLFECKSSMTVSSTERVQAEQYALLLHYFHALSHRKRIIPVLLHPGRGQTNADQANLALPFEELASYWIDRVMTLSWAELTDWLLGLAHNVTGQEQIDGRAWDKGAYRPVPTIIDAALSLRRGLSIREIAHAHAAPQEIEHVTEIVLDVARAALRQRRHCICFLTGVPGAGKTLVGLDLSHTKDPMLGSIHFMSGNGPLVRVLQEALAQHEVASSGLRAMEARLFAKTLIENIHIFAKTSTDHLPDQVPSNRLVIFDEAQRAWDRAQNERKFGRAYSEPEMLLNIMERHEDGAVIVALVGGGQEINTGEAGLAEWGRALVQAKKDWQVVASPEALDGGVSVAGTRLRELVGDGLLATDKPELHLGVSIRTHRATKHSYWIGAVLNGDHTEASRVQGDGQFPIFLVRDLRTLKAALKAVSLGESRCGLVGSSAAQRLRAEGLEPSSSFHAEYSWEHWYLAPKSDIRSSEQLEVFATEFEVQGLELDWVGVCWGGDMVWSSSERRWLVRSLRQNKKSSWAMVRNDVRRTFRLNAYRVLLSRARQGMILFVPQGANDDHTRKPEEFDETAAFLRECGAKLLSFGENPLQHKTAQEQALGLFDSHELVVV